MRALDAKILLLAMAFLTAGSLAAADRVLPPPKKDGGKAVLAALETRASATAAAMPKGAPTDAELGTLLWAAAGRNRDGAGWTVPTAMGRDPYCAVFVVDAAGVFRYDGKAHTLRAIDDKDHRAGVALQDFARQAPCLLVFVAEGETLTAFGDAGRAAGYAHVLVGAMTQNVYLAAGGLGLGVRYVASLNAEATRMALRLKATDIPICIMPVGK